MHHDEVGFGRALRGALGRDGVASRGHVPELEEAFSVGGLAVGFEAEQAPHELLGVELEKRRLALVRLRLEAHGAIGDAAPGLVDHLPAHARRRRQADRGSRADRHPLHAAFARVARHEDVEVLAAEVLQREGPVVPREGAGRDPRVIAVLGLDPDPSGRDARGAKHHPVDDALRWGAPFFFPLPAMQNHLHTE